MTLSPDEYQDHLKTTAVRAGFSFGDIILPSDKTVLVGHLRFGYLDWGNDGLRPLLFLHGGALTAHTWDLCCLALRDEFHCVALDQRRRGKMTSRVYIAGSPQKFFGVISRRLSRTHSRSRRIVGKLS